MSVNPATASLYAANPLPRAGLSSLFQTHPPTAERVLDNLKQMGD